MKLSKRILSAILSAVCAGSAAFSGIAATTFAENTAESVSLTYIYDNINTAESKEADANAAVTTTAQTTGAVSTTETTVSSTTTVSATDTTTAKAVTTTTAPSKPLNVFDIYDAYQNRSNGDTQPEIPIYVKTNGIDVSQWQGDINWSEVSRSGIDFAIIRAGYGKELDQKDTRFDQNVTSAQAAGINCGVYWYSYALTVEAAYQEAETCYQIIKNYDFTYPVYFDMEERAQESLSTAEVSAIIEAFCSTLQAKGYYAGIYSYANFLSTKVYSNVLNKYAVWVAHYGVDAPGFSGSYGMWQYGSTGRVNGIEGDVDTDYGYINYPYLITGNVDSSVTENPNYSVDTGLAQGIDVSLLQGGINWNHVATTGVDFAIIRAGYGKLASQKDKYFDNNIKYASEAGIKCGVYWYSYAANADDARREAEACYEVIKNYKLDYPVYIDLEDPSLSQSDLTAIANAFCSTLEAKGYYVGVMGSSTLLNSKLDSSVLANYDVWVKQYGVKRPVYKGTFGIWRYSNSSSVFGVNGKVNRNYAYYDYPGIMREAHLNGY